MVAALRQTDEILLLLHLICRLDLYLPTYMGPITKVAEWLPII